MHKELVDGRGVYEGDAGYVRGQCDSGEVCNRNNGRVQGEGEGGGSRVEDAATFIV